jgi:hypothetical protein
MATKKAQLNVMTNNPTNYNKILAYGFRGVAFVKQNNVL